MEKAMRRRNNLAAKMTLAFLMVLSAVTAAWASNEKPAPMATTTANPARFAQALPPLPAQARLRYGHDVPQLCIPAELYQNPIVVPIIQPSASPQQNAAELVQILPPIQQHDGELVQVMPKVGGN